MKTISFIGPRLVKDGPIGTYGEESKSPQKDIIKIIDECIRDYKNQYLLLTSLQGGIETWAAQSAINNGMMFEVIIPFENYDKDWKLFVKSKHAALLGKANSTKILAKGDFSVEKMRAKDTILLECDKVVAFYPPEILNQYRISLPKTADNRWQDIYNSIMTKGENKESYYIEI